MTQSIVILFKLLFKDIVTSLQEYLWGSIILSVFRLSFNGYVPSLSEESKQKSKK